MTDKLSLAVVKAVLKMPENATDQDIVIQGYIDAGMRRATEITGHSFYEEQRLHYPERVHTYHLARPENRYEVEVFKDGNWQSTESLVIGDRICLQDCTLHTCLNKCDAPSIRIVETKIPCQRTIDDMVTFVWEYVAYRYENTGAATRAGLAEVENILKPYRRIAFA